MISFKIFLVWVNRPALFVFESSAFSIWSLVNSNRPPPETIISSIPAVFFWWASEKQRESCDPLRSSRFTPAFIANTLSMIFKSKFEASTGKAPKRSISSILKSAISSTSVILVRRRYAERRWSISCIYDSGIEAGKAMLISGSRRSWIFSPFNSAIEFSISLRNIS